MAVNELSVEDVKQLLLDLYVVQRENARLRAALARYEERDTEPEEAGE